MKSPLKQIIFLAVPCLFACTPYTLQDKDTFVDVPLRITKADAGDNGNDGTTVSAYLFNLDVAEKKGEGVAGTYFIRGTELVPCSITGDDIVEDSSKGLRIGINTQYVFSLVSPAENLQKITGTDSYYGIPFSREQEPGKEKRFIFWGNYNYSGFYLDSKYSFNVGNFKEKRSKFRLKIICADTIEDGFTLRSASLTSVLKSTWYLPQTGLFYHSDASDNFESEPVALAFPGTSLPIHLNPGESVSSATSGEPYIISQDYSALDDNHNPLYVMPRLQLHLGEGEGTVINIPLNYNFASQEIVTLTITIKSTIARVSLSIDNWESTPASSAEFDYQPSTDDSILTEEWNEESDSCTIGE